MCALTLEALGPLPLPQHSTLRLSPKHTSSTPLRTLLPYLHRILPPSPPISPPISYPATPRYQQLETKSATLRAEAESLRSGRACAERQLEEQSSQLRAKEEEVGELALKLVWSACSTL